MHTLLIASCGALGIFLGAQIAEGMLIVPYWKRLSPEQFFTLHKNYGPKLYLFFAPLTIAATFLPLLYAIYSFGFSDGCVSMEKILLTVSVLGFFSSYYLYFKKANRQFFKRTIADEKLPVALITWEKWHWTRVGFASIAFICALLLLANPE